MSEDPDYLFALQLQEQLNRDIASSKDADRAKIEGKSGQDDIDYQLAMKLQAEINGADADVSGDESFDNDGASVYALDMSSSKNNNNSNNNKNLAKKPPPSRKKSMDLMKAPMSPPVGYNNYLDQTQNLVHPEWELVDPTPDIFAMFVRFDQKFFQKRLGAVVVEWSKRMYSCAGICYQRGNRFVKEVIIRLSEPLLKLRPRKDLVETLLHEMIHAYCFVLNIREGNGGHGPNFKRIMGTINKVAGTNITVYHSFHDEVDAYKTHIWRCNGVCQYHNPFQGWVKRTANRPPGPSDQWWAKHQRDCGGTFEKVSEPAKPAGKPMPKPKGPKYTTKFKNETTTSGDDIRNYFGKPRPSVNLLPQVQPALGLPGAFPPTSYPGLSSNPLAGLKPRNGNKNLGNVVGLKDLVDLSSGDEDSKRDVKNKALIHPAMQGQGYSMTNSKANDSSSCSPAQQSDNVNRNHLREVWSKRFANDNRKTTEPQIKQENSSKRRRVSDNMVSWESYDNDVMVRDMLEPVISISDSDDEIEPEVKLPTPNVPKKAPQLSSHERTINIKREVMEDETMYGDDEIFMIDDEYDDSVNELSAAAELADQSIIDDLFGEDTLLQEFQRENDVVPCSSRYQYDAGNDITSCPICFEKMKRSEFSNHLDGCSITIRVAPPTIRSSAQLPGDSNSINKPKWKPKANKRKAATSKRHILKSSGYSSSDIAALDLSSSSSSSDSAKTSESDATPRQVRQRTLFKQTTECPKCGQELLGHQMEAHRKICKRSK
ncbi:sprT-like domain-containing protein Spartan [Drosophila hydei]|uniref:Protein with SprT-like domain at the N terminus n=1 Tax=Drosophila hydei TaxID=7224 RepID=A0A6J1LLS5_DROHY|nr:sprT-like domain-containing protein Spartan [Drosophila hydei]